VIHYHRVAALVAAAALVFAAGCAAMPDERRATFGIHFPPPAPDERPTVIVFMVDGVNSPIFTDMLDAGRLPNLKKYFVDRGLFFNRCTANIPSVTLVNETSLVTGLFSGHHGITGNTWFDRNRLVFRNYEEVAEKNLPDADYTAPTLFERLPDVMSMSLFYQLHRGTAMFAENVLTAGPAYFFEWYGLVDRISLWRFDLVAQAAAAQHEFPGLVYCYLLSADMEGYGHGVSSPEYRWALEHSDAHIGRILRDLEAAGRLDKTYLVLVSDHGMMDVTHHWPIRKFFIDDLHLAVAAEEPPDEFTSFERRLAYYDTTTCVLAGSGDRYWAIYLRRPLATAEGEKPAFDNWLHRPSLEDLHAYPDRQGRRVDVIDRLVAAEAVDAVAYRAGPDRVQVATRQGVVEISRSGGRYALRTVKGEDPLGYRQTVPVTMIDGSLHDAAEWLAATAASTYPDLVPQIMCYFDAEKSGDLVAFAMPGWDFNKSLRAGHGGLRPEEMFTVLLVAGPGVPRERRTTPVRSVDVVPTVLDLLGRPEPEDLDGCSVLRKP
jgi:predicted AlkP superfamily pyrophosphatase or phosphodiesterase